MNLPLCYNLRKGKTAISVIEQQLLERDSVLEELQAQLLWAKMKDIADKRLRDVQFEVGELLYVKICPYRQKTLATRLNEKLSPKFYGPFAVEKRIGKVAYKLSLPPSCAIHPIFHLSSFAKLNEQCRRR